MVNESNNQKASLAIVQKYLTGIDFPVNKEDLINQAKQNKAPDEVTTLLNQLEDLDYEKATEVSEEIGMLVA